MLKGKIIRVGNFEVQNLIFLAPFKDFFAIPRKRVRK